MLLVFLSVDQFNSRFNRPFANLIHCLLCSWNPSRTLLLPKVVSFLTCPTMSGLFTSSCCRWGRPREFELKIARPGRRRIGGSGTHAPR